MTFTIDEIQITLTEIDGKVLFETEFEGWTFSEPMEAIQRAIEKNYWIVKQHYSSKVGEVVTEKDLQNMSLKVTLAWYQLKRGRSHQKDGVPFLAEKEFDDSYTSDYLISYFRKRYPDNYADKCLTMLGWTQEKLDNYNDYLEFLNNK